MRFSLVRVLPSALDDIKPKDCFSLGELGCTRTLIELSATKNKDSLCFGFALEGKLMGVAGAYRSWPGSSQAWAIFDSAVDAYPIAITKTCLSLIEYAKKEHSLHRLSLTVRSGFEKGHAFAKSLGFIQEGEMRKYLPDGGDAKLYARLF
jgi:hypothetical protein